MRVLVHQFSGGQLLAGLLLVSLGFLLVLVLVTVVMVVLVSFGGRLAAFAVLTTTLRRCLTALPVLTAALRRWLLATTLSAALLGWLAAFAVLATALPVFGGTFAILGWAFCGWLAALTILAATLLFGVGLLLAIGVGRACRCERNKSDHAHEPNKTRLHKPSSFSSDSLGSTSRPLERIRGQAPGTILDDSHARDHCQCISSQKSHFSRVSFRGVLGRGLAVGASLPPARAS